jgi:hypothetical protein
MPIIFLAVAALTVVVAAPATPATAVWIKSLRFSSIIEHDYPVSSSINQRSNGSNCPFGDKLLENRADGPREAVGQFDLRHYVDATDQIRA